MPANRSLIRNTAAEQIYVNGLKKWHKSDQRGSSIRTWSITAWDAQFAIELTVTVGAS